MPVITDYSGPSHIATINSWPGDTPTEESEYTITAVIGSRKPQWNNLNRIVSRVYSDAYSRRPQLAWIQNPNPDPEELRDDEMGGTEPNPDYLVYPFPSAQWMCAHAYYSPVQGHSWGVAGVAASGTCNPDIVLTSGTTQDGSDFTITLESGASSTDQAYRGAKVRITGGYAKGLEGIITDYNGSERIATVGDGWNFEQDPIAYGDDPSIYEITIPSVNAWHYLFETLAVIDGLQGFSGHSDFDAVDDTEFNCDCPDPIETTIENNVQVVI